MIPQTILKFSSCFRYCQFSTSAYTFVKRSQFPPRPKIVEEEIEEVFIKGGGKGGQKINKTNSKVQLRHIPTGIVVSSQHTRSREQNRAKAREILAEKVDQLLNPETCRTAVIAEYNRNKARKKKSRSRKKYSKEENGDVTEPNESSDFNDPADSVNVAAEAEKKIN